MTAIAIVKTNPGQGAVTEIEYRPETTVISSQLVSCELPLNDMMQPKPMVSSFTVTPAVKSARQKQRHCQEHPMS